jgi:hypothetical protein
MLEQRTGVPLPRRWRSGTALIARCHLQCKLSANASGFRWRLPFGRMLTLLLQQRLPLPRSKTSAAQTKLCWTSCAGPLLAAQRIRRGFGHRLRRRLRTLQTPLTPSASCKGS